MVNTSELISSWSGTMLIYETVLLCFFKILLSNHYWLVMLSKKKERKENGKLWKWAGVEWRMRSDSDLSLTWVMLKRSRLHTVGKRLVFRRLAHKAIFLHGGWSSLPPSFVCAPASFSESPLLPWKPGSCGMFPEPVDYRPYLAAEFCASLRINIDRLTKCQSF